MNLQVDLFEIEYERIVDTITITLTDDNYEQYGYLKDEKGYYLIDESDEETKIYFVEHDIDVKQTYNHILPNPSKLSITYSDVDKEGSGRSEADGMTFRERLGHYQALDVVWDIVENSKEGKNLIRILKNLPPSFTLRYHDIENESDEIDEGIFYHGDINYGLYLFLKDRQIWNGISTSFIQYDVTPYDDSQEPILLPLTIKRYNVSTNSYETKEIDRSEIKDYLETNDGNGVWELINE